MSINNNISETAIAIASLRALSVHETDVVIQGHDVLAEAFLPVDRQAALRTPDSREIIKKQIPAGMYEYVIARTKFFDSVFVDALKNSFEQIVFLGAGFDSRSYRFHQQICNTKIFELDTRPTQQYKLKCLRENNISIHPNITFIEINFETDDLITTLCRYGYEKQKQTLFLWEGVTFYLSQDAVVSVLTVLRENSGQGSQICFDFQTILNEEDLIKTGLKDEVIKFGINPDKIANFVHDHQYRFIEHVNAEKMEQRFLTLKNNVIFGKIMPIMNFLLIEHD